MRVRGGHSGGHHLPLRCSRLAWSMLLETGQSAVWRVGVEAGGESGWESGLHCPGSSHFLSGLEKVAPSVSLRILTYAVRN